MEKLTTLYNEIKYLRDYLVKLGEKRRTSKVKSEKCTLCASLFEEFNVEYDKLIKNIESLKLKEETVKYLYNLRQKVDTLYSKILDLCSEPDIESESEKNTNMAKFELKTAISLLPVMTDDENVTKQLISNIELYDSMLEDSAKPALITFVLKSRLSESAKLRLCESYESVSDLVRDIRERLLSKKSPTALQQQLHRAKQDNKTIEQFGKEIEQLFVDLTISQAAGNSKSYEVLRPINEKYAIKQFSDGLRNSRISTIIAARNYTSLKDAISGALDEAVSSGQENQVMSFRGQRGNNFRGRRNFHQQRPYNFNRQGNSNRGQFNHSNNANNSYQNNRGRGRSSYNFRTRSAGRRGFSGPNRFNSVNMMQPQQSDGTNAEINQSSSNENLFFRS
ncbi:uncharacterized protein LOC114365951 [Ostrinia furnacalis]|uniref:uncharacterized protein LOC114365951 n=1 Tax=Ostrinia furnacalis TaxID=93504 RepID=UPI00103C8E3B|nr:uncharacterized protein LOC114365951 [Ostrinia furnacalis]